MKRFLISAFFLFLGTIPMVFPSVSAEPIFEADVGGVVDIEIDIGLGGGRSGGTTSKAAPTMPSGPVFSGPGMREGADTAKEVLDDDISKSSDLKGLISGWAKSVGPWMGVVAGIAIWYAGFSCITAMGEDGQTEKAKKIIFYVVGGILLIFGAYAIVNTIMSGLF
mgnify:CR=1 FL=1